MGSIVTLTSERLCLSCILPTYRVDTYYAVASRLDPTRNLVLFQNKTQSNTYNNLQRHSTTANSFASPSHSHSFCLLRHLPRGLAQPLMKLLFFLSFSNKLARSVFASANWGANQLSALSRKRRLLSAQFMHTQDTGNGLYPSKAQLVRVMIFALAKHLAHTYYLGRCPINTSESVFPTWRPHLTRNEVDDRRCEMPFLARPR